MSISKIGGSGSDNWVEIYNASPGSTTLNVTGIPRYKKIKIIFADTSTTIQSVSSFRFNADTGSNYRTLYTSGSGTNAVATINSPGGITTSVATANLYNAVELTITGCDTTGLKPFEFSSIYTSATPATTYSIGNGFYLGTSIISQVNITWASTYSSTVRIYGAD